MKTLSPFTLFKALAYLVIGVIAAVLVTNTLRVPMSGPTTTYVMQFEDAEGLLPGNPVTISGVRVGRVEGVALRAQPDGTSLAEVEVKIDRDQPLPENVHATVRYGDMLGARYISLRSGDADGATVDGNSLGIDHTSGPVNLTALMNGFEPLFSALEPEQVNELARGFVDTFEGRTGSVELLLEQISRLGTDLSANSAIFARLVTNLSTLMGTVNDNSPQLITLFDGLNDLTSEIVGDNGQLAALLDSGDKAVGALAGMMTAAGDDFQKSLTNLESMTGAWIPHTGEFTKFLDQMPTMAASLNNSGRYGGFMMLYLCNFTLKAFDLEANIFGPLHSPVCL